MLLLDQIIPPYCEPVSVAELKGHMRVEHTSEDVLIATVLAAARHYVEEYLHRQLVCSTWTLYLREFPRVFYPPRPPLQGVTTIQYVDPAGTTQTLSSSYYTVDRTAIRGRVYESYGYAWPAVRGDEKCVILTFTAGYVVPYTANATSDLLTFYGRNPVSTEYAELTHTGGESGALPGGLSANTLYYARDVSGATCKLAASSGGSAIDLTSAGTGQQMFGRVPDPIRAGILLLAADLYEHREARTEARVEDNPTVQRLLWPYRILEAL